MEINPEAARENISKLSPAEIRRRLQTPPRDSRLGGFYAAGEVYADTLAESFKLHWA